MIVVKSKPLGLGRKYWFSRKVTYHHYPFVEFYYSLERNEKPGYIKISKFTTVVDLVRPEDEILASFNKDTRYKINRAEREKIQFSLGKSLEELMDFHNRFAENKGIDLLTSEMKKLEPFLVITQAELEGEVLVKHSYIVDPEEGRARLKTSASHYREAESKTDRALIGRANRFLHYFSMLHFRDQGYGTYDFGGYAVGTEDPALLNINRFKDAFRGELIEEFNFTPTPMFLMKKLRRRLF